MNARVLLVEDDQLFCQIVSDYFTDEGIEVVVAQDLASARATGFEGFDVVVLDNKLPDGHGLDLIAEAAQVLPRPRILVLTANPGFENAVEALRLGIDDYLTKPISLDALRFAVLRGAQTHQLERIAKAYRRVDQVHRSGPVGASLDPLLAILDQVANSRSPILITGETGTGKSLLARAAHERSGRSGPLIRLNCGALPTTLLEAELFGVERGAFTGATPREGLFESAQGGTLFLDEIGELEISAQSKLLGTLDDGLIRRLGSSREKKVDVRVIAATNVDLEAAIRDKRFRRDLFYRLSVVHLEIPPLRHRLGDLPELVASLVQKLSPGASLAPGELEALARYSWPGNVRELHNVLERAALLQPKAALRPSRLLKTGLDENHLAPTEPLSPNPTLSQPNPGELVPAGLALAEVERRYILQTLELHGGHREKTAVALGIGLATLRRKLAQYRLA